LHDVEVGKGVGVDDILGSKIRVVFASKLTRAEPVLEEL
jgi:hypothetical protein